MEILRMILLTACFSLLTFCCAEKEDFKNPIPKMAEGIPHSIQQKFVDLHPRTAALTLIWPLVMEFLRTVWKQILPTLPMKQR